MKKKCSALLAVILAIAMLVTMMPSLVFAADTNAMEQVGSHRMVDPATGAPVARLRPTRLRTGWLRWTRPLSRLRKICSGLR